MIYYLTTQAFNDTIGKFLQHWGDAVRKIVSPVSYEDLFQLRSLPSGTYVFADLERLPGRASVHAARLWSALTQGPTGCARCLNHPTAAMRRYEMLRNLHAAGINDFNVYRLTEARMPVRYPVFIRRDNDHRGNLTGLIKHEARLHDLLRDIERRGLFREELIITELADTRDTQGIYRKYSSFYVAGQVIPRHVFFSRGWMIKKPDIREAVYLEEEWEYMQNNPHRDKIAQVFQLARIDYGRIDYSISNGRIQVWEINTNPMIAIAEDRDFAPRLRVQEHFVSAYSQALQMLNQMTPGQTGRATAKPASAPMSPG